MIATQRKKRKHNEDEAAGEIQTSHRKYRKAHWVKGTSNNGYHQLPLQETSTNSL